MCAQRVLDSGFKVSASGRCGSRVGVQVQKSGFQPEMQGSDLSDDGFFGAWVVLRSGTSKPASQQALDSQYRRTLNFFLALYIRTILESLKFFGLGY